MYGTTRCSAKGSKVIIKMNENTEYRGYFFTNMYLSDKQCGIQCAHCIGRMARAPTGIFNEWIHEHETIILLNGGNSEDLDRLYDQLLELTNNLLYDEYKRLPVARFHEDKKSLNEATTCVGIVLPDSVYNRVTGYDFGCVFDSHSTTETKLKMLISKYRLV